MVWIKRKADARTKALEAEKEVSDKRAAALLPEVEEAPAEEAAEGEVAVEAETAAEAEAPAEAEASAEAPVRRSTGTSGRRACRGGCTC